MSKIKIKIMGIDPVSKLVLVACNSDKSTKTIDEQSLVAFPFDFGGATNVNEFLVNIQDACREKAFDQDRNDSKEFIAYDWVGATVEFEPTEVDTSEFTFQDKKDAIYATYPPANMDVVRELCNTTWRQMQLAPLRRDVDATIVGVYVNGYGGTSHGEAAMALRSIKEATERCIELGIPMCGGTTPVSGMERDRFVSYLTGISEYNRFISTAKQSYVYQDWNFTFAKNRKKTFIDSERNAEIASGVTYAGYTWDSDDKSRANVTNFLAANTETTVEWRTKDNQMVVIDVAGLGKAFADHVTACFQRSWDRKEALKATTTEEEVNAI